MGQYTNKGLYNAYDKNHKERDKLDYYATPTAEVENILDELKLLYVPQYRFDDCRDINPLPFDFYLNEYNVAIEVDGEGHYYPIKYSSSWTEKETLANFYTIKKHDKIKTKYCINNNIELIRIPYYERNNLKSFLTNKLIEKGVL